MAINSRKGYILSTYQGRLLLVDDDEKVCKFYSATFAREGYTVSTCNDLEAMREALQNHSYDAVFLDLNLGNENGLDGLPHVLKNAPYSQVFILTSQNNLDKAVECMDAGATWYFTKGSEPTEILAKMNEFLQEKKNLEANTDIESWRDGLVGESPAIKETYETIRKLKSVDSTVLILGESGTGKEIIARALHQSSDRSRGRFEAINCGAIPENLLESELFGHKKGAFTDAKADRKGIFEICSNGTLLLDEIGDMPLTLQTKLLRVLQERQIMPVGSTQSIDIQTRVIAATHRDILDEVKSGRFREDLYYRLSVVVINIPALRHRKEDIPLLVNYFLERFNKRFKRNVEIPTTATLNRLTNYDWPGNIRELQNAIERGVVLSSDNTLSVDNMFSHLHYSQRNDDKEVVAQQGNFEDHEIFDKPLTDAKQLFEKTYIERMLRICKGNVAELARKSGRYRADLYRMLDRYEIKVDEYRQG